MHVFYMFMFITCSHLKAAEFIYLMFSVFYAGSS